MKKKTHSDSNLFCSGLRASRDPGLRGQRADERPGLRPGDARQEPWLPPQAVSGKTEGAKLMVLEKKLHLKSFSGLRAE